VKKPEWNEPAGYFWKLIFRQTYPNVYGASEWSKNPDFESDDNYAILDELETFRDHNGQFTFKMAWPTGRVREAKADAELERAKAEKKAAEERLKRNAKRKTQDDCYTELTKDAQVGAKRIEVASTAGCKIGDKIAFGEGQDPNVIRFFDEDPGNSTLYDENNAINKSTLVFLDAPLNEAHKAGTDVGKMEANAPKASQSDVAEGAKAAIQPTAQRPLKATIGADAENASEVAPKEAPTAPKKNDKCDKAGADACSKQQFLRRARRRGVLPSLQAIQRWAWQTAAWPQTDWIALPVRSCRQQVRG
jgi:hypothetical protein